MFTTAHERNLSWFQFISYFQKFILILFFNLYSFLPSAHPIRVFTYNLLHIYQHFHMWYSRCPTHTDIINLITITQTSKQHRSWSSYHTVSSSLIHSHLTVTNIQPCTVFQTRLPYNTNWTSHYKTLHTAPYPTNQTFLYTANEI
jgi:hypothetical protein